MGKKKKRKIARRLEKLQGAAESHEIVRVRRSKLDQHPLEGRVASVGPELVLLEPFDEALRPDGFSCVRLADVTSLELPEGRRAFLQCALEVQGLQPRDPPAVDLSGMAAFLRSVAESFPVVVLHLEKADPGVCYVGKILDLDESGGSVELRRLSSLAKWDADDETGHFPMKRITRIEFGTAYEDLLLAVAAADD